MIGHSESERRGADRFECAGLQFHLTETAGTTTITMAGYGQGETWLKSSYPSNVRAGHEVIDRIADWIEDAPLVGPLAEDHASYRRFGVY